MSITTYKPIQHYVDNDKFFEAIIEYKNKLKEHREKGIDDRPAMSNYLGDCFLKIAENYSHKPSFIGYKFREDMVQDAVYFCVKYIDTFNPERTKNPFAYFTTACHNAFLQKIEKEHKNLYINLKSLEHAEIFNELDDTHTYGDKLNRSSDESNPYSEGSKEKLNEFVANFEKKMNKNKKVENKNE